MANITFLGAAGTVTGSKYLVEAAGKRLLIDCGIFQGSRELRQRNWDKQPLDVSTIDWVVLTHAHLDHTGWLPCLVRDGYRGPIFADPATIELANILLPDSAHIMEEDAADAARRGKSRHNPVLPLYTHQQVAPVLSALKPIPREGLTTISPQFTVRLRDAGHILGSTNIELTISENGKTTTVVFSGDIGRYDQPILKDPVSPPNCDVLLCESTYGDRDHPTDPPDQAIADVVNRVAKRGGVIVVPAFAVGRTQTVMYVMRQLEEAGRIPHLPVYVDSPMAISVTSLYLAHREDQDEQFAKDSLNGNPLDAHTLHLTRSVQESKQINAVKTPAVIISASGMANGGRVMHHLVQRLPDARNAVMLAGFQAEGTTGRQLQDGAKTVRLLGQEVEVRAEIQNVSQFSAHADRGEILRWLGGMPSPPTRTIYLTHGEPAASQALKTLIESKMGPKWKVVLPAYRQTFDLNS
ncbi:MAG: MBL fold metallo-hydrolase [Candidatus Acidiferrales bacterium]